MFKSNLEMCWNIKVNFADPCNTVADHQGAADPRLKTPVLRCCSCYDLVSCLSMRATWTWKAAYRCWQGLNLRGETPMDFKSIALTTRPQQHEEDCFFNTFQDNVSTRVWECKWKCWAKDYCDGWESNPGQLLGRQLCLPLYHHRHKTTGIWLPELDKFG